MSLIMSKMPLTELQKENIRRGVLRFYESPAGQIEIASRIGKPPGNKGMPGPEPWNKGKRGIVKLSPQARQRISDGSKKKRIIQLTMTGEVVRIWPSMHDAGRALHVSVASVSSCCSSRIKSAGGYIWRYDGTN